MKQAYVLAAAILFAAVPLTAGAQAPASTDQKTETQSPASSGNTTTGQGIKKDAAEAKQNIKSGAKEAGRTVKKDAAQVKRKLAVAVCNDGRYSYTHHKTCNEHGGVKTQLR